MGHSTLELLDQATPDASPVGPMGKVHTHALFTEARLSFIFLHTTWGQSISSPLGLSHHPALGHLGPQVTPRHAATYPPPGLLVALERRPVLLSPADPPLHASLLSSCSAWQAPPAFRVRWGRPFFPWAPE